MEKYITYRVIAATGSQTVEQIVEISNNTEEVDTTVNLSYDAPSRTVVNDKGTDANLPIANGNYGLSKNNLTDVRLARLLSAPEILYVLREPVTVSAPIADVPFIAATIPLLSGTLNTSPTMDIRIEGALYKTGNGSAGYDLYISDSATSLVGGLKIATLFVPGSVSGAGFKRTFTLRPSNIIEGYSFTTANLIDTVTYGGNSPSTGTMPNRNENVYIHLVSVATAITVNIRAYQLNAIKLSPPPPPPSNDQFFDVRMDWEGDYLITDEQTFSDAFEIEVENFVMLEEGNRIQCDYISGSGGQITIYNGVIFALPRISWEILSASNTSFGVNFVFPESLFAIQLTDYPDASIPDLPTDILEDLSVVNALNLTSFPDLPPTVISLLVQNCPLIDQAAIDKLATEFLQGDLPKYYWNSFATIEPSVALRLQIEDNTTFGAQF